MKTMHLVVALVFGVIGVNSVNGETITLDPPLDFATGHVPEPIALGDVNGDGRVDAVIANTAADGGEGGDNITVLLGEANDTFTRAGEHIVNGRRPEYLVLAQVNGDGILDVVTSNYASNTLSVLLGAGDGRFGEPGLIPVPGGPRSLAAADFDGDGDIDLATSNHDADDISTFLGDGAGGFTPFQTITVGNGPELVRIAQLTGDGDIDLITCNRIGDTLTALKGNGAGSFQGSLAQPVSESPRFICPMDLDGDALDDLILANYDAGTITIERNIGSLTFSNAGTLISLNPAVELKRPCYLDAADMDGDGRRDILASWSGSDAFTISRGTAEPFVFEAPQVVQTGKVPVGIAASDFDGDGAQDVIVTNAEGDTASVYLSTMNDPGIIVDNGFAGTEAVGPWAPSDVAFSYGSGSVFSKNGTRYAWSAELPGSSDYEVLLWWTVTVGRSTAVPVEVQHAEGNSSLLVDQSLENGFWHSLGVYRFDGQGTVVLTAPQDGKSVSADAVRFRQVSSPPPGPPRGKVRVESKPRPEDFQIDSDTLLVFQGTFLVDDDSETQDLTGAILSPVGPGNETDGLKECRLYVDSNGNSAYDAGDRQVGTARTFTSDIRSIVFDGFVETLVDGNPIDFFVVAERIPPAVASCPPEPPPSGIVLAFGAAAALAILRKSRRGLLRLSGIAAVLLPLLFCVPTGCKGSGGGGGKGGGVTTPQPPVVEEANLQVELSSIIVEGSTTSRPAAYEGFPAQGWRF